MTHLRVWERHDVGRQAKIQGSPRWTEFLVGTGRKFQGFCGGWNKWEAQAQAEVAEVLRISPRASLEDQRERMPFKDQAVSERYLDSLRKAGLPE